MKTILEIQGFTDLTDDRNELIELIEAEIIQLTDNGDLLSAGEWLASELLYLEDEQAATAFAKLITFWASPLEIRIVPSNLADLITRLDEFVRHELTVAFVAAVSRLRRLRPTSLFPVGTGDLAFRLSSHISDVFNVHGRRSPEDLCIAAAAQLESTWSDLIASVDLFLRTGCTTAKGASLEVIKYAHRLRDMALPEERPILSEIDILLGPSFRKFCESCEKNDPEAVLKRVSDIQEQTNRATSPGKARTASTLWNLVTFRIANHISIITDESIKRSRGQTTPSLRLSTNSFKIDLTRVGREILFSSYLLNEGEGRASAVQLESDPADTLMRLEIVEPRLAFDVGPHSQQLLKIAVELNRAIHESEIAIRWKCRSATGHEHQFEEKLSLQQQRVQPNWDALLNNPPYTTNPIRRKQELFGRDAILNRLKLNASAGTSTFLWGQKRVGKTSLLQVLNEELNGIGNFISVVLRMGELGAMHEGQLAYTIAERVVMQLPANTIAIPQEPTFGAGLGRLVPFAELLRRQFNNLKFAIIIDEFDDFDPAFYTGERGRLFVKALRSLSEVGFTFIFVGSERMNSIYSIHAVELNKWVNLFLDCIESREDRKALIIEPVKDAIEYDPGCVDFIVEYCGGNPFYMHLFCSEMFQRCLQENRTYVSESDAEGVRQPFIRSLGETNFSHFWSDNPTLDPTEKIKQSAENCLVLCCIASLGGTYESTEDLLVAQESLGLGPSDWMSGRVLAIVEERLTRRNIIGRSGPADRYSIQLPIFRDWLCEHAQLRLLPMWREFSLIEAQEPALQSGSILVVPEPMFPIPEDELVAISQRLIYLGRQKDVSEIRVWLRQFDDDIRIEIAFLLLKRLAEKGYISEGAKLQALTKIEEAIRAKRTDIGGKVWSIVRGRRDNLCISFVDSETKSGATTARELAKRLQPGKTAASDSILEWMKSHVDKDPMVVFVDDFCGTGQTIDRGLQKFLESLMGDRRLSQFLIQRRIFCYLLYAFPEGLERLRSSFNRVQFLAAHVLDTDVRALDEGAGIFENSDEINFAKDILLQTGRGLVRQYPLGWGDLGALVAFHNTVPNNTLPIFWANGTVNNKAWKPLFPRA